jgi:hypothetical protein
VIIAFYLLIVESAKRLYSRKYAYDWRGISVGFKGVLGHETVAKLVQSRELFFELFRVLQWGRMNP